MKTKISTLILLFVISMTAGYALTPKERKLAEHARGELNGAFQERDIARAETAEAKKAAADSAGTAAMTEQKAGEAAKAAKIEHDELVRAAKENATMRPIVEKVNAYWGIGGILYGFGRLAKHLLILAAVIIALCLVVGIASKFVPWLSPVLKIVNLAIAWVIGTFWSLLKRIPFLNKYAK